MMKLFTSEETNNPIRLPMKDAEVWYYPNFYSEEIATTFQKKIMAETEWQEDDITVFGKTYKQPRLTALYGDDGKSYSYSNIKMQPKKFTSLLEDIKNDVEKISNEKYTTVLLNLYRDGSDSNGWHSDDEKELGKHPFIASLSFGAKRTFHFKHKHNKNERFKMNLKHGSLLLMGGTTQAYWQHQLPKSKKQLLPRINLTFRNIKVSFI
ncbi:alkylated DNA repair protein [Patiriisocius marinistellae]|uniref:Alkylated DNA repair protein n=1 Tax=Patiriisocius marinistellae TaxID=2494560 RepID=A0A5J4G282_9FLAO|nr:alpha-ketoglutarate-dependent dioxygenase AlkB [Patiriisocius marinistellae]GEQ86859.1 alkylated DNA repair protein [Patiriisocius marinistellae]